MLHGLKAQSRRLFDTIHLYYYERLCFRFHCDETQSFERARGFETDRLVPSTTGEDEIHREQAIQKWIIAADPKFLEIYIPF